LNRYLTFWLCNTVENAKEWQVWLEFENEDGDIKVGGRKEKNSCQRFILKGDKTQGVDAWEYN
jgi:hypothetical protein